MCRSREGSGVGGGGGDCEAVKTMENQMTVENALSLARDLKYGPLPKPDDPTPTIQEAIEVIHEARRTCGHTWLTGEAAIEILREHRGSRKTLNKG